MLIYFILFLLILLFYNCIQIILMYTTVAEIYNVLYILFICISQRRIESVLLSQMKQTKIYAWFYE